MGNKYHNQKSGGFDSRKEERRYHELYMLEKAGQIFALRTQVPFELIPAQYETYERYGKDGKRLKDGQRLIERACIYRADFVYIDNSTGKTVVEDVKGYKDGAAYNIFSIKRKLMLHVYGIKIKEV